MAETPAVKVLVTGGAGYIGNVLVPKLAALGHQVTVLDALHFGEPVWDGQVNSEAVRLQRGDIRDSENVHKLLAREQFDVVIHLAAIANDPCADLDEELSLSTNRDAVVNLMRAAKMNGVRRFLYASSASVYGIKDCEAVTEDLELEPITIYARLKAECEAVLNSLVDECFCGVSVRAATVCGYSPRLRLDLTINLLTEQAVKQGEVRVFGGDQERPNVHVEDLADFYILLMTAPAASVNGEAFNVCKENATVRSLAERIRDGVDPRLPITVVPTEDRRSYRLSPDKAQRVLGFSPRRTIAQAIQEVHQALTDGRVADSSDVSYRNVAFMQAHATQWSDMTPWQD